MAAGKWPHLFPVNAEPGTELPPGAIRESRIDACERSYKAGNPFAVSKAVNICAHEGRPLPAWLNKAVLDLVESEIERRPKILKKIKDDMTHLHRMEYVLSEIRIEQETHGKKLPLAEAFARAATRLGAENGWVSKDPSRLVEASYNEGLAIANDADRRAFLAPFISDVLLQHFASMTARKGKGTTPGKKQDSGLG
jgi:hypothetical protein